MTSTPFHTGPEPSSGSSLPVSAAVDPGFGVYVHWPFCQAKCPYCDFNSHVRHGGVNEARFRSAYLAELDHMAQMTGPREVGSIFLGGGTPSRMQPETVAAILERIATNWTVADNVEVTLEANPTSVEAKRFAGFRAAGVNRVSVGLQALDDGALRALGRTHGVDEGLEALAVANGHFERVSFDLIYARPGQAEAAWREELKRALDLASGHLSLYQLTIEPGTPFAALHAQGKLETPGEEDARRLYEITHEECARAGLPSYEVSNYAAPGAECRHNLVYWRAGEYAGVGPGAHSRLDLDSGRHALSTLRGPEEWRDRVLAQGHGIETTERLSGRAAGEEYMLMGMRLTEGIDLARHARMGGDMDYMALATMETDGLVRVDGNYLSTTFEGRLVLDAVIAALAGRGGGNL